MATNPTRDERVATAQRLRAGGLKMREIADEMGLSSGKAAWRLVNAEEARAENLARNDAKRASERRTAGPCPLCGGPRSDPRTSVCIRCARARSRLAARGRTARFIALRRGGKNNIEIAAAEGVRVSVVATVLHRASRYGLDVGPSPYRERGA